MSIINPEVPNDDDELGGEGHDLRQLRAKAKLADEAEARVAALEAENRELTFKAVLGDQMGSDLGQIFVDGYKGDLDSEAIAVKWAAVAGNGAPTSVVAETSTSERQALVSDATGDTGQEPTKPVLGRNGEAVKAGMAVLEDGGTREEAMGTTFATIVQAAESGDRSVMLGSGGVRDQ